MSSEFYFVGGCATTMDTDIGWAILNHYVLAFARQRLLADDSSHGDRITGRNHSAMDRGFVVGERMNHQ